MGPAEIVQECPKCGYKRKPSDSAPAWQCPSCQVVYGKYVAPVCPSCGQARLPREGESEGNCTECGTPYGKAVVAKVPWCDEDGTVIPEAWRTPHHSKQVASCREKLRKPAGTPIWGIFSIGFASFSLLMPYIVSIFLLPFAFIFGIVSLVVRRPWLGLIGIVLSTVGFFAMLHFSVEMARGLENLRRIR